VHIYIDVTTKACSICRAQIYMPRTNLSHQIADC
jgi:hypothetical protein